LLSITIAAGLAEVSVDEVSDEDAGDAEASAFDTLRVEV
jgi:hypothetical protein